LNLGKTPRDRRATSLALAACLGAGCGLAESPDELPDESETTAAPYGQVKYGLVWFDHYDSVTKTYKTYDALNGAWERNSNVPLTAYDPKRPILIYFHGWQPGANGKREDFMWNLHGGGQVETLKNWKSHKYNVGIYFWDQFADNGDSSIFVSRAESKIWSTYGPNNLCVKIEYEKNKFKFIENPTPAQLNLPVWKITDPETKKPIEGRWGETTRVARIAAGVKFVLGKSPQDVAALSHANIAYKANPSSCRNFVEQLACKSQPVSNLCNGDRPEWREAFEQLVCGPPAVGDFAVVAMMRALAAQTNPHMWFAGHSLGHQLATRTALRLWLMYEHSHKGDSYNRTLRNARPTTVDLLDPYATTYTYNTSKPTEVLSTPYSYTRGNLANENGAANASTANRVLEYHRRLNDFGVARAYYLTSNLGNTPGATVNPVLMAEIPTERVFFDYLSTTDQATKHVFAPKWYFSQMLNTDNLMGNKILDVADRNEHWSVALSPLIGVQYRKQITDKQVHFAQTGGNLTPSPDDDKFTVCSKKPRHGQVPASRFSQGAYDCSDKL
jgi:hypothetical protein